MAEKAARKVLFISLSYQFFNVSADFSASAATSDPVLNDGSSNVALMAVKTKEELEEQVIAIAPSAERGHLNAPINVSPHLPPPGAGWGIFLVWNGRLAPGVGILNR